MVATVRVNFVSFGMNRGFAGSCSGSGVGENISAMTTNT
jgi:hypothetical protein